MEKLRIDKWLWAARFYKTRSLAVEELDKNRVRVNGVDAKPAREIKVGDTISLRQGPVTRTIVVRRISNQRSAAPIAQQLYEESEESLRLRVEIAEQRKLTADPASQLHHGRPTKRDRRDLEKTWNNRWSASSD